LLESILSMTDRHEKIPAASVTQVMECHALDTLITVLQQRAFTVIGPTIRDGAIVYDEITSIADLPGGWTDTQGGGTYRLTRRSDAALFGYAVGPHSW
jgi:sulfhydrogenase subunit beta (sulfur reductase)